MSPNSDEDSRLLSHDETIDLIAKAQAGAERAKEELVRRNIALVKSIVKRFLNRGHEYEDLLQIGVIGLIKAIKNYNPAYNVRFSTYAVPMIMGEIKRFLRDDGPIKISRSLKELANKAILAKEQLKAKLDREPTIKEISGFMGIPAEDVVHAVEAGKLPFSIYDVVYEDEDNPILLIDKMSERGNFNADLTDKLVLKEILSKLEKRERIIIMLRYFHDKTQSDIAEELGISQVQVSRIEKKVLLKMKEMM